ncbi:unnamed protein product, partial [Urochloa humidicola]
WSVPAAPSPRLRLLLPRQAEPAALGRSMDPTEATRKRARRRRRRGGDPDLLSALPDCLLHVIMSSLKARQAVQTCVLSTRWRDLWRSVPCLDIDFDEFRAETAAPSGSGGEDGPDADDICGPDAECS